MIADFTEQEFELKVPECPYCPLCIEELAQKSITKSKMKTMTLSNFGPEYAFKKYLHHHFDWAKKYYKNNRAMTPREHRYIEEIFNELDKLVSNWPSQLIQKKISHKGHCAECGNKSGSKHMLFCPINIQMSSPL